MAEGEGYTYRILTVREWRAANGDNDDPWRRQFTRLIDLGEHSGRDPDIAIENAVEALGLPDEDGGRCIAVPTSRWHERDVVIEKVPRITVDAVVTEAPPD